MEAALNQMQELFAVLLHDAVEARKRITQDHSEHSKRAYVRAFFALVEGYMASMKGVSLATAKTLRVALSDAESALLKEEAYAPSNLESRVLLESSWALPKTFDLPILCMQGFFIALTR